MINSPKSSLKREDFMVKSENQFRTCITQIIFVRGKVTVKVAPSPKELKTLILPP